MTSEEITQYKVLDPIGTVVGRQPDLRTAKQLAMRWSKVKGWTMTVRKETTRDWQVRYS